MTGGHERFLIVTFRGEYLALRLQDITEVRETFRAFPIPRAPACYLGAFNSHGSPTPIVDLAAYMYGDSPQDSGTLLLLDHRIGTLALRIDRVERIIHADSPAETEKPGAGLAELTVLCNEEAIRLLNLERLVAMLEDEFLCGPAESSRPARPAHEVS